VAVGLAAPAPAEAGTAGIVTSEVESGDVGVGVGDRHISAADVLARLAG
jgi:hypothetical protein